MAERPSGTVTFLFTDIEGSTRLWERQRSQMQMALERHDQILRGVFENHGGYVFATGGDGFAVAFQSSAEAISAALAAQQDLDREPWPEATGLRVRLGLHTGEVEERDGDYFGPAVNLAARVMSAGHGGQVLVSDTTRRLVSDMELVDLGEHRLRGLSEPLRIWQAGPGQFAQLRVGGESGNLPSPASSFLGRRGEIGRLGAALGGGRTVTLLGAGGVGKTRLAIETAVGLGDEFSDGVWFCDLAPVGDPESVVDAVAAVLGVRPQSSMSMVESITDSVGGRRMLVLLDNCEHVLEPCAVIAASLNAGTSTVAVLATSREPLGIQGEQVWAVPALDAAVDLFVARGSEADADFAPDSEDMEVIAGVCAQLDGMPLAIELAAARVRSMTVGDIAERLGNRFRLLRGSGRGGIERHQTLAATVQWSHDLLGDAERELFDRLCVFAGSFDTEAAAHVCADAPAVDEYEVMDLLASLVDKSMVIADRTGPSVRYRLVETFRQFGEQRLGDDLLVQLKDEHMRHYLQRTHAAYEQLRSPHFQAAYRLYRNEWDNIRAAMGWALASQNRELGARLLTAAFDWGSWNLLTETGDWSRQLIELGDAPPTAYGIVSFFHGIAGDFEAQLRVGREGLEIANWEVTAETSNVWGPYSTALRIIGDRDEAEAATRSAYAAACCPAGFDQQAYWAAVLALLLARRRPDEAADFAAESEELMVESPPHLAASILTFLSLYSALSGDLPTAESRGKQALEIATTHELAWATVQAATNLAYLASHGAGSDPAGAFRYAVATAHANRCWFDLWPCLNNLTQWWGDTNQHEAANILAGYLAAKGHRRETNQDSSASALDPDRREWFDHGAGLDREELIGFIDEQLGREPKPTHRIEWTKSSSDRPRFSRIR